MRLVQKARLAISPEVTIRDRRNSNGRSGHAGLTGSTRLATTEFSGRKIMITEERSLKHSPYSKFSIDKMILRDFLAMDRTTLANERTLLAYGRTSLMIVATGITLIKLFNDTPLMVATGYGLVPVGIAIFFFGLFRYAKIRGAIYRAFDRKIEHPEDDASLGQADI